MWDRPRTRKAEISIQTGYRSIPTVSWGFSSKATTHMTQISTDAVSLALLSASSIFSIFHILCGFMDPETLYNEISSFQLCVAGSDFKERVSFVVE